MNTARHATTKGKYKEEKDMLYLKEKSMKVSMRHVMSSTPQKSRMK